MPDEIYYEPDIGYDEVPVDYVEAPVEDTEVPVEEQQEAPEDESEEASFRRRIIEVQRRLKAPKSQWNGFGKYAYRNCEDILEALKPLLKECDLLMCTNYDVYFLEGRFYIKATVTVADVRSNQTQSVSAFAREPENKKGSDQSQVTGSCSSYAHKYALSAMWLIDDNKDPDEPVDQPKQPEAQQQAQQPVVQQAMVQQPVAQQTPVVAHCENCGTRFSFDSVEYFTEWVKHPVCCPNPRWVRES